MFEGGAIVSATATRFGITFVAVIICITGHSLTTPVVGKVDISRRDPALEACLIQHDIGEVEH